MILVKETQEWVIHSNLYSKEKKEQLLEKKSDIFLNLCLSVATKQ